MHLSVVGGGWAGISAAVHAAQRGWTVTLWEASRQLGGRARTLAHQDLRLDNGQHILIGAYTETLALMRTLAVNPDKVLHRQPLTLLRPGGYLLSFSCSGAISLDLFQKILAGAVIDAGVDAQLLRRLAAGVDHPMSMVHPEGEYLKGLLLQRV